MIRSLMYYLIQTDQASCCFPLLFCPPVWWSAISSAPISTMMTLQTGRLPQSPVCLFHQVLGPVSPAVPVQALSPASPRARCPNSLPHSDMKISVQNRQKAHGREVSWYISPNTLTQIFLFSYPNR